MDNIQFVLKVIMGVFLIIVIGKILYEVAAYIGEILGLRTFVNFLLKKIKKID